LPMRGKEEKARGRPTRARLALAANIKRLLEVAGNPSPAKWGKAAQIGRKTAERLMDPYSDISPKLETIDLVAEYFQVETWELLRRHPLAPQDPTPKHGKAAVSH